MRKGCEAYLDYVIDTVKARPSVFDILIVSDFPDMFPEELPGLPPHREIEFAINVVSGATPASITPYRMAPLELKELKLKLHEILEKKKVLFDQVYPHVEPPCFLLKRKMVHFDYVLIIEN